jgi:ElaB/YqjD/DUF883 family membrane-anchored ribosome-binding protein
MSTTADHLSRIAENAEARAEEFTERKASQLEKFFDDVEDLVRRVTHLNDTDITRVRRRIEGGVTNARDAATRSVRTTIDGTRKAAKATDNYVQHNPWKAIGVVAIAGLAIGALLKKR